MGNLDVAVCFEHAVSLNTCSVEILPMKISKLIVFAVVLPIQIECSVETSAGPSGNAASRFDAEYPAAFQKLNEFYSRSRITIKEVTKDGSLTYKYSGNGVSFRCDETSRFDCDERPAPEHVIVANPELSFRLSKGVDSDNFSVLSMGKAEGRKLEGMVNMIRLRATPAFASYCFFEFPIPEFIKQNSYKKIHETRVTYGATDRIRIEWDSPMSKDRKRTGYFEFDPDRCWAITEYQIQFERFDKTKDRVVTSGRNARIEYSGQIAGVPLIKAIEIRPLGVGDAPPSSTLSVESLLPGAAPDAAFKPEAFGLGVKAAPPAPLAAYFLALAGLSAATAIGFRLLRNRQDRGRAV